jgi:hypothetical protein
MHGVPAARSAACPHSDVGTACDRTAAAAADPRVGLPIAPWRRRLTCSVFALTAGVGVATGCGHSNITQPPTGSQPTSYSRLVDTFAFNVTSDTNWLIAVGNIATYLIGTSQRGEAAPPTPIRPRLLTDTIAINDTLGGPPLGTDLQTPTYLVFDAAGNLWMSVEGSHGDGSVVEYTRAQISQNGNFPPSITLAGTKTPLGLRFDPKGRLWVVDSAASALYGYTTVQVVTGGGPAADTVSLAGITTDGVTWAPVGLAVDALGDLWVSALPRNPPSGGAVPAFIVVEFTAAAVQAGGTPTPTLALTGSNASGVGPAMTFDSAGDLWTANADLGSLTKFTAASLTPGSNPAPAVTLSNGSFSGVGDIAIDANGILYVGGGAFGSPGPGIFALRSTAIGSSGSPTPALNYTPETGVTHFTIR